MSSFPTFSLPLYSEASWSTRGAIARQGPHQAAQKSTSTGSPEARTSFWKLSSVKVFTSGLAIVSVPPRVWSICRPPARPSIHLRPPARAGNQSRADRAAKAWMFDARRGCATRMADYLFVPQSVLDRWSEQGRIAVDGNVLTILGEKKSFALTSAVRFIKMEAGDDNAGLLQKVKTTDALKQMGAEHYRESVILGENAYQVQQGFLADANALRRAAAASQPAAPKAATAAPADPAKPGEKKEGGEQDMLERFLLDNL